MTAALAPPTPLSSRLGTEFGIVLAQMVASVPGALAAVLSDDLGDAIDFAYDPKTMTPLDVQLVAAQLGQPLLRLTTTAGNHDIDLPALLLEAQHSALVASTIAHNYIAVLVLRRRANFAMGIEAFEDARAHLRALLL